MKTSKIRPITTAVLFPFLISIALSVACQEMPPEAPDTIVTSSRETYRLRVENAQHGSIEISVDCGEHFLLIGRVTKPAIVPAPDRQALKSGSIIRSNTDGIAVAVSVGQAIKILPAVPVPRGKLAVCAIMTDIKPRTGIFGEFLPPAGTEALQQVGHGVWKSLPEDYVPTDDTVLAFMVTIPGIRGKDTLENVVPDPVFLARLADVRKRLAETSAQYNSQALTRAREMKRSIVSGVVTLRPGIPAAEPEPIVAISYRIDGDTVSVQNTLPSVFGWDTTRVPNGEHVVEIRGLSKHTTIITRVRALVVVNNP